MRGEDGITVIIIETVKLEVIFKGEAWICQVSKDHGHRGVAERFILNEKC